MRKKEREREMERKEREERGWGERITENLCVYLERKFYYDINNE